MSRRSRRSPWKSKPVEPWPYCLRAFGSFLREEGPLVPSALEVTFLDENCVEIPYLDIDTITVVIFPIGGEKIVRGVDESLAGERLIATTARAEPSIRMADQGSSSLFVPELADCQDFQGIFNPEGIENVERRRERGDTGGRSSLTHRDGRDVDPKFNTR